jgi:hypothetical protein
VIDFVNGVLNEIGNQPLAPHGLSNAAALNAHLNNCRSLARRIGKRQSARNGMATLHEILEQTFDNIHDRLL